MRRTFRDSWQLKILTVFCVALLVPVPGWAQAGATIEGTIIDASENPVVGAKAVWFDAETGVEYTSAASSPTGAYSVSVPVGGRYQIKHLVSADGSILKIQQFAPVRIQGEGVTTLDILMTGSSTKAAAGAAATGGSSAGGGGGLSTGAIVGIVVGAALVGAVIAVALTDDDEAPVSAF